jgi:hypothetical protein
MGRRHSLSIELVRTSARLIPPSLPVNVASMATMVGRLPLRQIDGIVEAWAPAARQPRPGVQDVVEPVRRVFTRPDQRAGDGDCLASGQKQRFR